MKAALLSATSLVATVCLLQWQISMLRDMISGDRNDAAQHFALLDMDVERLDRQMVEYSLPKKLPRSGDELIEQPSGTGNLSWTAPQQSSHIEWVVDESGQRDITFTIDLDESDGFVKLFGRDGKAVRRDGDHWEDFLTVYPGFGDRK